MASSSAAVVPSTEEMEATAPAAVLDRGYDCSGQAEEEQEEYKRNGGDDDGESEEPKAAASEIDLSKLEIGRVVAHGDQDVSGYLTGGTLKQHLINHYKKKLAYKEVVKLALGLAKGLSFLHSRKIVHRNVKTEKILLDSHMRLKIADFSVARVEAHNPKDMTGTTDLSFVDLSSAIVNKDLRPEIPWCCPSAMASIMRRCWDANPDVRPEMDEVVRLLEALDTSKGGGMVPEVKPGAAGCFCFFRRRPRGA
ncbi:hypothetical protein GUJ93_ZPchr0013g37537 [Zizania palustris]|uniref:Protein kinase domain-containing protein n=1 Tax=Zizania palustris TaxID=103762 RepID=A0A8J5WW97_ZIZPA|nr:hypothetical protein GUJ93_ZPchr0013g37537 [Zizania palustris]